MIFYTSDLHLGHVRINELCKRPFSSTEEMNQALIDRWNHMVDPGDQVMVLGDFLMGQKAESFPLVHQLNGAISLVPGNHDACHPMNKGHEKWLPRYQELMTVLPLSKRMTVLDHEVLMCHFPPLGDSGYEDRYPDYRLMVPDDQWLLHGHVHEKWRQKGRWINVGVDAWGGYPVSVEQITTLMMVPQDLPPLEW